VVPRLAFTWSVQSPRPVGSDPVDVIRVFELPIDLVAIQAQAAHLCLHAPFRRELAGGGYRAEGATAAATAGDAALQTSNGCCRAFDLQVRVSTWEPVSALSSQCASQRSLLREAQARRLPAREGGASLNS
jgi:hypothetical protein